MKIKFNVNSCFPIVTFVGKVVVSLFLPSAGLTYKLITHGAGWGVSEAVSGGGVRGGEGCACAARSLGAVGPGRGDNRLLRLFQASY